MNNSNTWRTEQPSVPARGSIAPFETTMIDNRLNSLRELTQLLLNELASLEVEPSANDCSGGLQAMVQRFESDLIRQALHRTAGNQARAARILSVKPTTLNAKIRRYNILVVEGSNETSDATQAHVFAA
jgi:transcriptional regulator with GAF, ATPase, and Fis domain